jgi:hypothetical protein
MFYFTKGYLNKVFQSVSFFEASAQTNTRLLADKASIRLIDTRLPLCKITQVFHVNTDLKRFILTDSEAEAYIFLDSDTLEELEDVQIENGSIILLKKYSFMDISTAVQIYGGLESHYNLKSEFATSNKNKICVFLKDFQVIGMEVGALLDKPIEVNNMQANEYAAPLFAINKLDSNMKSMSWNINAMLTKMSELKYFTSTTGKSCCFVRFQFSDSTGTIELVAFNQLAQIKMVQELELNSIYRIEFGDIKTAKSTCSAWNSSNCSKYEIMLTKYTQIHQINCDQSKYVPSESTTVDEEMDPQEKLHGYFEYFTPISQLRNKKIGSLVDVCGTIESIVSGTRSIERQNGKSLAVKNFTVHDSSYFSIEVAMWGLEAEYFDMNVGDVIEMRKMKLTNYSGLSLSKLVISSIKEIGAMNNQVVLNLKESALNMSVKRKLLTKDFSEKKQKQ